MARVNRPSVITQARKKSTGESERRRRTRPAMNAEINKMINGTTRRSGPSAAGGMYSQAEKGTCVPKVGRRGKQGHFDCQAFFQPIDQARPVNQVSPWY